MTPPRGVMLALAILTLAGLAHCRQLKATTSKYFSSGEVNLYYIGGDGLLWNALPRAKVKGALSVFYNPATRTVSAVQASAWTTWVTPLSSSAGPFQCTVKMVQYGRVSTIGGTATLSGLTPFSMLLPGGTKAWWSGEKRWSYYTLARNTLEVEMTCTLQLKWDIKNAYNPAGDSGVLRVRGTVFTP
ncbi:hypothetical protein ABPG75_013097 [Micractinium tetrahymenae]